MSLMRTILTRCRGSSALMLAVFLAISGLASAEEPWIEALRHMPLAADAPALMRSNCMQVLLASFQSNAVIKALVFLPGVGDDFYLLNRHLQALDIRAGNLWEAVAGLTNATHVRATFRTPFVLLHVKHDKLRLAETVFSSATARRLDRQHNWPRLMLLDRSWRHLSPVLEPGLGLALLPVAQAEEGAHFARCNLAGWGLSDLELLRAISLSSRTKFTVSRDKVKFAERGAN